MLKEKNRRNCFKIVLAAHLDLQTSSESAPNRILFSCSFAPRQADLSQDPSSSFSCSFTTSELQSRCLFTSSSANTRRAREEKTHSAPPFHRTDLIPPTRASSAENNHSCVGWESAANQSAAADMTWRHPTAHFVRDRRTNREAGEQKWKWKRQTTALLKKPLFSLW